MSDRVIKFRSAVEKLQSISEAGIEDKRYMADMSHWLTVHATKYMPIQNNDGNMYIPSTAMVNKFTGVPRNTVHVTMNHVVAGHMGGNWDNMPIVILSPYNSVVQNNGNPAEIAGTDTYWSVDPDKGLVLPPNTVIIKPDNNGPLYNANGNIVTYKTDNYTSEEVQEILSMLNEKDLQTYNRYMRGELNSTEMNEILWLNPAVKKAYDNAKDKQAFLRGYMEEARYEILTHFLRDKVIKLTVQNMGYNYVQCLDSDYNSCAIEETANANGLKGNRSNKGHSNSVYGYIEREYSFYETAVKGGVTHKGVFATKNADDLYLFVTKLPPYQNPDVFLSAIVSGKAPDLYSWFRNSFEYVAKEADLSCRSIADFDANLDKVLRRTVKEKQKEFNQWLEKIKQWPDYDKLVAKLKSYQYMQNMQCAGQEM